MKNNWFTKRVLPVILMLALLVPMAVLPTQASTSLSFKKVAPNGSLLLGKVDSESIVQEPIHADTDMVRVSIVLEQASTIEAGYSTGDIASNNAAMTYRASLKKNQDAVAAAISKKTGTTLNVVWNLTLAANIISANVMYGDIAAISEVAGVKQVVLENSYTPDVVRRGAADPNMATSASQIGTNVAWGDGYTGAGSKVAIIDTGIDIKHIAFDNAAFQYSLAYNAGRKNMSVEDYIASLDLLTAEKIADVASLLNVKIDPSMVYQNAKVPFAYNYVDENYNFTHETDTQGEHGSHVTGIAAANTYVPNGDGTFKKTIAPGVAPDAQIVTMKVFGAGGGAYDSDYMVAIEDALTLGCDSVNLSLGSGNPGFSREAGYTYQAILDKLAENDTVVTMSAGNSGSWVESAQNGGYLYGDDVALHAGGSPGSFTNSFAVASVDNDGTTGAYFTVNGETIGYVETAYSNAPLATLAGTQSYVFIDAPGTTEEFASVSDILTGKVAVCYRGSTSFYQKAEAAVEAGAIACIIVNNQPGTINMDLSDYSYDAPVVSVLQTAGEALWNAETASTTEGGLAYCTGTMEIGDGIASILYNSEYYTMSDFSSWGVPGSLQLKPEITAPGGNIYSVWGANNGADAAQTEHDKYESMSGTSMAAPQVTGMAGVVAQYIRETELDKKTGLSPRQLINALLMSTSVPVLEKDTGYYYSVLKQGSGLGNVGAAVSTGAYLWVKNNLSGTASDGKVKVELGDDPLKDGVYSYVFTINDISGEERNYSIRSDFFTQDMFADGGQLYLDTWTAAIAANVKYVVDGVEYVPTTTYDCDLDGDGETTVADAQLLLDMVSGKTEAADAADIDGDGKVTSLDARMLLESFVASTVTVPANGKVEVAVTVALTYETKAFLKKYYTAGAYIEGFTFVTPEVTAEGERAPVLSVPVLGFFGNWSEPSMYDHSTYVEQLYEMENSEDGSFTPNYVVDGTNFLSIKYQGDPEEYMQMGNPYVIESEFPADRAAINGDTVLSKYYMTLIRNAAAVATVVTNQEGKVLYCSGVANDALGAFYYVNGGSWQNTQASMTINKTLASFGAKEGDVITVSMVAVPEYYVTDGAITQEQVIELVESGTLGKGAFLSETMIVDNTAPELLAANKDLLTGKVTVAVRDNNNVAAILVTNKNGTKTYAAVAPGKTDKGETIAYEFDLASAGVGEECQIIVADYADNKTAYILNYGGEPESFSGNIYGFTNSKYTGTGNRWVQLDLDSLYYQSSSKFGGQNNVVATTDVVVTAAAYVEGYVFMAADDGAFYVSTMEDMGIAVKVGNFTDTTDDVYGMSFNYADQKMYVLGSGNTVYTMDLTTGELTEQYQVTITNPRTSSTTYARLNTLAIDFEGNVYAGNYSSGSAYAYIYKWTAADVTDGAVTVAPITNTTSGNMGSYAYDGSALAFDYDTGVLYMSSVGSSSANGSTYNRMYTIDTATGKGTKVRGDTTVSSTYGGNTGAKISGLFIVPTSTSAVRPSFTATSIELSHTELAMLKGGEALITAIVYPWNLEDKSVTWTSDNEEVVTVKDGVVTAVGVGSATVTATSNVTPTVSATLTVTVEKVPTINLSGLVYKADGTPVWAEFNTDAPAEFTEVGEGAQYAAGTLQGDKLLVHDGSAMYTVDADDFSAVSNGTIASSWLYSDAAPMAPELIESFGGFTLVGPCMNGTYLECIDPASGSLTYWSGFASIYAEDPMALIAYAGLTEYNGYDAGMYFVMTESGELWMFLLYNAGYCARLDIGATGINLEGVAQNGDAKASMIYDAATGYLVISKYLEGDTASLYAVDTETLASAKLGEFGADVWPVVSLYQYTRVTELTVFISETAHTTYVGSSFSLSANIKPKKYTGGVVWSSSDDTVATVDANGVVTGVGEGTAVITATSVDVNDEGNTVSASCTVTVKPTVSVDVTVNGQVTAASGTAFASINLADRTLSDSTPFDTEFIAGGMAGGKIIGVDAAGYYYQVNGTTLVVEDSFEMNPTYIPIDVTNLLPFTTTIDGTVYNIAGGPIFLTEAQGLYILDSEGYLTGFDLASWNLDLAAIAFAGVFQDTDLSFTKDGGYVQQYFAVTTSGDLYIMLIYADGTLSNGEASITLRRGSLGNIGVTFSDITALSSVYNYDSSAGTEGLTIVDRTDNVIYYVDMTAESYVASPVGTINGVTNISTLYGRYETYDSLSAGDAVMAKRGNRDVMSYAVPMGTELARESVTATKLNMDGTKPAPEKKLVKGDLNAVKPTISESHTASVEITEDTAVTNGKYVVKYDASVLTVSNVVVGSASGVASYNVDEANGTVTVTFAALTAVEAGDVIATVNFTFASEYVNTTVTVDTLEVNDNVSGEVSEQVTLTIEIGGHVYETVGAKEATCTEEGYTGDKVCKHCGDTVKGETIPVTAHNFVDGICTACGELQHAIGDINGDGEIDEFDYILLKRSIVNGTELTAEQKLLADVNGDGEINAFDYLLLKRTILGLIN